MIFVTSCAQNTLLPIEQNCTCDIIFGRTNDWNIISDELVRNIYRHNKTCEEL